MGFKEDLEQNVRQASVEALLVTVVTDPERSIGEIFDALEEDEDAAFLKEVFRDLSVRQVVHAAVSVHSDMILEAVKERMQLEGVADGEDEQLESVTQMLEGADEEDEEDEEDEDEEDEEEGDGDFEDEDFDGDESGEDEDEDEDEDGDSDEAPSLTIPSSDSMFEEVDSEDSEDESDEDEDEEESEPVAALTGRPAAPERRPDPSRLRLHEPSKKKHYQDSIIKVLRKSKAHDVDTAMSSKSIRVQVGGDTKQLRDNLAELIQVDRVAFTGKARGTKYYLVSE